MRATYSLLVPLVLIAVAAVSMPAAFGATIVVTSSADSGAGTLREALTTALSGDDIVFDNAVTSITLVTELTVATDVSINGPGAASLTVSGGGVARVFNVTIGTVAIRGMTITNGAPPASTGGGGILSTATALTVERCVITSNTVNWATFNGGGGVHSSTNLTIRDSTISNNSNIGAGGAGGGFWIASGDCTVERCTISGNSADRVVAIGGGTTNMLVIRYTTISGNNSTNTRAGIYTQSGGGHILENCTITNNVAATQWGGFFPLSGTWTVENNTITGNSPEDVIANGPSATFSNNALGVVGAFSTPSVASLGYNIVSDAGVVTGWIGTDMTGTAAAPINLVLGALANNGGPTQTMLQQVGSPLLDFVPATAPDLDQRGLIRLAAPYDAGATEVGGSGPYSIAPDPVVQGGSATLTGENMTQITNVTIGGSAASLGAATATTLAVTVNAATPVGPDQIVEVTANAKTQNWLRVEVIATAGPEMDVQRPAGTSIADGGSDALGNLGTGAPTSLTYTIENTGTADLNLTGTPIVAVTANANCTVNVTTQPTTPVTLGGGTTTFVVDVTPTAAGAFDFDVSIDNDDANENPYNFNAAGTGVAPAPEMDVQRPAGTSIADGGNDALGNQAISVPLSFTYTIENTGTADLTLTGAPAVATGATTNCTVNVTTQPTTPVTAAGTTTFVVQVTVTAGGAFSFGISIDNNDADENPYDFTVAGTGVAVPEIDVQRPAGTSIASGANDNVGNLSTTAPTDITYTIENQGTGNINLTAVPPDYVTLSGEVNCTAIVFTQPTTPIAGGATTTFIVRIQPSAAGACSVLVTILNDDTDESTYTFTIDGTGVTSIGGGGGGCCTAADRGSSRGNLALTLALAFVFVAVFVMRRRFAA